MAKLDLTSQEWCQLIFEGKNQKYGAYLMRADSAKRHNIAMVVMLILVAIMFSIPLMIKWANSLKPREEMTEVTTLSKLDQPDIKQEEVKKVEPVAPPPLLKTTVKFTAPVIKKDEEVNEEDEIKSQEELNLSKGAISIADVVGNDDENGVDIADLKQVVVQGDPEPEKIFDMVEQMPSFNGNINEYLSKNIKYPTIAQENGTQGRVIMQFVVEPDGSITNVQVARGVDPYLDKEAERVIKGMPKWTPGRQNGKAVRVKFTVPVLFRLQ